MNRRVWLASYPKSGNTWFRAIWSALRKGNVDVNALLGGGGGLSPSFVEDATGLSVPETTTQERASLHHVALRAHLETIEGVVLTKLHSAFRAMPGAPSVGEGPDVRAIYLVRDPRDVAVSFARHEGKTVDEIIARMEDPDAIIGRIVQGAPVDEALGTWSDHVTGWTAQNRGGPRFWAILQPC